MARSLTFRTSEYGGASALLLYLVSFMTRLVRWFEAIFVGYVEHRISWRVRDLQGKYHFSWDIIFNESSSGRLKRLPRSLSPPSDIASRPSRQRILDVAGPQYAEVLDLAHTMRWNHLDRDVPPDPILPPASRVGEPAPVVVAIASLPVPPPLLCPSLLNSFLPIWSLTLPPFLSLMPLLLFLLTLWNLIFFLAFPIPFLSFLFLFHLSPLTLP